MYVSHVNEKDLVRLRLYLEYIKSIAAGTRAKKPDKDGYRRYGKFRVKETFAGTESLTSLLTQYVERSVSLHL